MAHPHTVLSIPPKFRIEIELNFPPLLSCPSGGSKRGAAAREGGGRAAAPPYDPLRERTLHAVA